MMRWLMIVMLLVGLIAACGGDSETDETPEAEASTAVPNEPTVEETTDVEAEIAAAVEATLEAVAAMATPTPEPTATITTVPATATPEPTNTPRPTRTPQPEPTATPQAIFEIGETAFKTVTINNGPPFDLTFTVHAFEAPVATEGPQPVDASSPEGWVWAAADVEICAGGAPSDGVRTSSLNWILGYEDNTQISRSSIGYRNHPEPSFPGGDQVVYADSCLRGWITYAVPPEPKPVAVFNTQIDGRPIAWLIPE